MTLRKPRVAELGAGSWEDDRCRDRRAWSPDDNLGSQPGSRRGDQLRAHQLPLPPRRRASSELRATSDLEEAVTDADVIVTAIPAQSLRSVLADVAPRVRPWIPIVNLAKGLERGTHKRMTEVIFDAMPGHPAGPLSGPNIAGEVARGMAAAATLAMPDERLAGKLADLFRTPRFRIYSSTDVVGVEVAGACKNVYAIAVGMADGAGAGENTKAMVMTRAAQEMTDSGKRSAGIERHSPGSLEWAISSLPAPAPPVATDVSARD
jgi:glycerol-3-phosphate dehydrogenase (NAD(P)+)